jgi:hypothetical protein
MKPLAYSLFLTLAACGGAKPPTNDSFDKASGKGDAFSSQFGSAPLPELWVGDTKTVDYSNPPLYRAFVIKTVAPVTTLDVEIAAPNHDADPIAWLLDSSFKILDKNDDARSGTQDSHIFKNVDPGQYYVVFREISNQPATFTVHMLGGPRQNLFSCNELGQCAGACRAQSSSSAIVSQCFLDNCQPYTSATTLNQFNQAMNCDIGQCTTAGLCDDAHGLDNFDCRICLRNSTARLFGTDCSNDPNCNPAQCTSLVAACLSN